MARVSPPSPPSPAEALLASGGAGVGRVPSGACGGAAGGGDACDACERFLRHGFGGPPPRGSPLRAAAAENSATAVGEGAGAAPPAARTARSDLSASTAPSARTERALALAHAAHGRMATAVVGARAAARRALVARGDPDSEWLAGDARHYARAGVPQPARRAVAVLGRGRTELTLAPQGRTSGTHAAGATPHRADAEHGAGRDAADLDPAWPPQRSRSYYGGAVVRVACASGRGAERAFLARDTGPSEAWVTPLAGDGNSCSWAVLELHAPRSRDVRVVLEAGGADTAPRRLRVSTADSAEGPFRDVAPPLPLAFSAIAGFLSAASSAVGAAASTSAKARRAKAASAWRPQRHAFRLGADIAVGRFVRLQLSGALSPLAAAHRIRRAAVDAVADRAPRPLAAAARAADARLAATANGRREDGARRRRLDGARESAELTPEMMELHALTRASLAGARGDLLRSLA